MIAERNGKPLPLEAEPSAPDVQTLWSELDRVYQHIARSAETYGSSASKNGKSPQSRFAGTPDGWNPVARLQEMFALSAFETEILLLCAGAALDRRFSEVIDAAQPGTPHATFGYAASVLANPHWSALSRMRPLRYWRLIETGPGALLQAPLQIDERILQYLLGVPTSDDRLESIFHVFRDDDHSVSLSPAMQQVADHGVLHWRRAPQPGLLITGQRPSERARLFHAMCRDANLQPWVLDAGDLPESPIDRERLARIFTREAALWPSALYIRTERLENAALLDAWLRRVNTPVAVDVETGSPADRLKGMRVVAPSMSVSERKALWKAHLGALSDKVDPLLDRIVEAFELDAREIHDTAEAVNEKSVLLFTAENGNDSLPALAWQLSRSAARRSLDELATHIQGNAAWPDLVLPDPQIGLLRQIALHARQSSTVHGDWGFGERYTRGLGLSALFSGASGTGKTMAAGVLARELDRDLYQIDLATVVSKYIGETEKHLRKIFEAAERSGAILLFDEADALFGKRSQVRDSHDRYANLEISYLLQRMESYRGIAILTTNMQNALDPAFQRRLRFVVQFPFPDAPSRERIWRKVFPASAPLGQLDFEKLAQLNVTGGTIRNIALLSAYLAADAGSAIEMHHLLEAARTEYAKLDKPLSAPETRGWA